MYNQVVFFCNNKCFTFSARVKLYLFSQINTYAMAHEECNRVNLSILFLDNLLQEKTSILLLTDNSFFFFLLYRGFLNIALAFAKACQKGWKEPKIMVLTVRLRCDLKFLSVETHSSVLVIHEKSPLGPREPCHRFTFLIRGEVFLGGRIFPDAILRRNDDYGCQLIPLFSIKVKQW